MYFPYFQIFSTKVPLKFEKYMKLLDIFGDIISKCPDIISKNTPLPPHSLDSSRSIELKLLGNHYETPCNIQMPKRFLPIFKAISNFILNNYYESKSSNQYLIFRKVYIFQFCPLFYHLAMQLYES